MGKVITNFIFKFTTKLIIVAITIYAYLVVDKGFSALKTLNISLSNPRQMLTLDILIVSSLLTFFYEAIIEIIKKIIEHLIKIMSVSVEVVVKETENQGKIVYFSKDEPLKNVIISYEVNGTTRKHLAKFFFPLGEIKIVLPDWVTINQQVKKQQTGHTRAIEIFDQNLKEGILNTYILVDLQKISNYGTLEGSKKITFPLICEDDDYVSSTSPLVVEWKKSETLLGKYINNLNFSSFEFTYKHSEKERHK